MLKLNDDIGGEFFPIIIGTLLVLLLVIFIISFVIQYRRAQLKFQIERQKFQQALLETEMEIREQTLSDLSRDLHDNFGQIASLIRINLNMLSGIENPEDQKHINDSKDLLKTLIEDMRALSHSLNPQNFKRKGLVNMVKTDVERINRSGFLNMELNAESEFINLEPEQSVFLYRMFQEMVSNILKHSEASNATVSIVHEGSVMKLQVRDNGIGLPSEKNGSTGKREGTGLINIRERCKIIGADYKIESWPNRGTFIEISLPTTKS